MSINKLVPILTTDGIQSTMSLEEMAGALDLVFNQLYKAMKTASSPKFAAAMLATLTNANNGTRNYGFLGDVPGVKEWVGSKVYGQMNKYDYKISNVDYYNAVQFGKRELRQSQIIDLESRIAQLVEGIMIAKHEAIVTAIINGDTLKAYDGIAFFSNASGLRTNDNLLAGGGVTLALISADIIAAKVAMGQFKTDKGAYLRTFGDTVVCPLALEDKFLQIKNSTTDAGQSNSAVVRGAGAYIKNVIADPMLDADDVNDWYFLDTSKVMKPIILQGEMMNNGQDVETVQDDTKWASDGVLAMSTEGAWATGYGHPATAVKIVNS